MIENKVAVCSRTFSRHPQLRELMQKKFSNIKFNDDGVKLTGGQLIEFLSDREGAIVALEEISLDIVKDLKNLKVVSKYGVGLNNIDQAALKAQNIALGWKGGLNKRAVSELALGMILDLFRKISLHNNELKAGRWKNLSGSQLSGKTVGIIGLGNIGKDLVALLKPFGCQILGCDIADVSQFARIEKIEMVSAEEIYQRADVVTLHVPYTDLTHSMIDDTALSSFKKQAILLNLSRGNIVDEEALYRHLTAGKIAGAALDVFSEEPQTTSPLFGCDNFIATPHVGGSSNEGIMAMGTSAIEELVQFFNNEKM